MDEPERLYAETGQRLLAAVTAIPDPVARIRVVNDLISQGGAIHAELARVTRDAVREMHDAGSSYAQIGQALGVTRARAHQLGGGA